MYQHRIVRSSYKVPETLFAFTEAKRVPETLFSEKQKLETTDNGRQGLSRD